MLIVAAMLGLGAALPAPPPCRRDQLRMAVGAREGVADLAPLSGAVLSIRNAGADCVIPALPAVVLRDVRGRRLTAVRRAPPGMHPGPVIVPIVLTGGHRATFELTWPYCPTDGRCARVGAVSVRFGSISLKARVGASIGAAPAAPFRFDQPPGRVAEGMASDLD